MVLSCHFTKNNNKEVNKDFVFIFQEKSQDDIGFFKKIFGDNIYTKVGFINYGASEYSMG
jgi:hypothetical protein